MILELVLTRSYIFRMKSDIEIAREFKLKPIQEIAKTAGIPADALEPYGLTKAKLSTAYLKSLENNKNGKLVLVTAISPTPAGEGKTTTTIGLGDALKRIGKKTMICLREPSIGPVFGMKGGATGGGFAQVVPMEDINLHFTGDFAAIGLANNLLAAMIDNHIHFGNELDIDTRRITWRRVVDLNDRALRDITVGLGGVANGFTRQDGFDIVVASEVMAIFCLAKSLEDLKERLGNIVIGYSRAKKKILARDIKAHGAMAVLLKEAFKPNLVQTLESTPALIHGGPFANIAHGCNSVVATQTALKLADYVVTEAGFGADLGAEKFLDIKCRKSGLRPSAVVIVATIRALKFHGGVELKDLVREDVGSLAKGLSNLERHVHNMRENFGLPCIVAINRFSQDTDAEIQEVKRLFSSQGVPVVLATHWADGSRGTEELARTVVEVVEKAESRGSQFKFLYEDSVPLFQKIETIAKKMYGASAVTAASAVKAEIARLQKEGYGHYPVCVAKTQYSFSTDPTLRGAPSDHVIDIREVRLSASAEFIVMICGAIMTMPGLPKEPSAFKIDLNSDGEIIGLS